MSKIITGDLAKDDLFSLMHNAPEAFVAITYEYAFIYVNAMAEKFYNKKSESLIGNNVKSVFPDLWDFGPFKSARTSVSTKKSFTIRYFSPFTNAWVQLNGTPYSDFYVFKYKNIDHKTALNDELRSELKRKG